MALFKRMKDMALAAAEGRLQEPGDDESQIALRWLEKIWKEMRKELNQGLTGKHRISEQGIREQDYYHQTLERIRRDESLAMDGWRLGHDDVSYIKHFEGHAQMTRARELLMMVNFADDNPTVNIRPQEDYELPDLKPDRELKKQIGHREKNADNLAVRRDWMEAFAVSERRAIGIAKG
jgi:hypothetical protein